jgi:hypothetical protein
VLAEVSVRIDKDIVYIGRTEVSQVLAEYLINLSLEGSQGPCEPKGGYKVLECSEPCTERCLLLVTLLDS